MTETVAGPDGRRGTPLLLRVRYCVAVLVDWADADSPPSRGRVGRARAAIVCLRADAGRAGQAIADATALLLSPADDPGGSRTRAALADLAALNQVTHASAPALASCLSVDDLPAQGVLFDDPPR